MAKIVLSELAPAEAVHFSFAEGEFTLGGKSDAKAFETTDRALLSNAAGHPWLDVQYDESEAVDPTFVDNQVRPEDDVLSASGPRANDAFDPEKIKAAEDAKREAVSQPVAIEAGLDQTEEISLGDVAETVAADDAHEGAKSAAAFTPSTSGKDDNKS